MKSIQPDKSSSWICTREYSKDLLDRSMSLKRKSSSGRRGRRRSSNSTIPCPVCGELYSRKDNLRVHQRIHSGEKPFKCDQCNSSFRWAGVLRAHRAVHKKQPENVCEAQDVAKTNLDAGSHLDESIEVGSRPCDRESHSKSTPTSLPSSKELTISIEMLLHHESDEEQHSAAIFHPIFRPDLSDV